MKNVKLFIYIPTFNRPIALLKQLSSLLTQIENNNRVRLVVNDNNSEINNEEIVSLCEKYSNVKYQKNFGNIGGNANIALGFVYANTDEFLWILSDNDIVKPGAVDYILDKLDLDIDFYCFVNNVVAPQSISHLWKDGWQKPMDWRMGLISDALYNSNTIRTSIEDGFYYHNSSFPHLAVACSAARKKEKVQFILLPRSEISYGVFSASEFHTDYSLAAVGMPFLSTLFPNNHAKTFCMNWLKKHWFGFYKNRKRRHDLFLQSKAVLRKNGGFKVKSLIEIIPIIYFLYFPFYRIKEILRNLIKNKLSKTTIIKINKFLNRNQDIKN
jgi:glycosyltransferase involved in cell wall biosynthesis